MILLIASIVTPCTAATPVFDVRRYGAIGDGITMDTAAIQKTIYAASNAGGGTVLLPPGKYLSGTIDVKSHVKLQLEKGATLLGSPRRADYRKLNYYGLLLADKQEDIEICGAGVIDGQGRLLVADTRNIMPQRVPPYANEGERPFIIVFRNCQNVAVRDITLKESSCWVQLYQDCDRITVENLTVRTSAAITNDGLDLDGCSHVIVRNCNIDSEDDGICLKSTRKACDDILIENCRVRSSCNAIKFGTASVVGFKNITIRNVAIYDTYLSAIALESVDGGTLENVNISHVKITDTTNPLFIRLGHRNTKGTIGTVRGVTISDLTAEIPDRPRSEMNKRPSDWKTGVTTLVTGSITGLPGHPVKDVTLKNITLVYGGIGTKPRPSHHRWDNLKTVPECEDMYPESTKFGVLPAWGLYCRHGDGIRLDNFTLRVNAKDYRPALICDDVANLQLDGFHVTPNGGEPVIVLNDVHNALVRNSPAPNSTVQFIKTTGATLNVKTQPVK